MDYDVSACSSLADMTDDFVQLPSSLIITNLPADVFSNEAAKEKFEALFQAIDENALFCYLANFKRCRVHFGSCEAATTARIKLDFFKFQDSTIRCFFCQVFTPKRSDEDRHLKLPELEKQFLISPPASPPVGWEQSKEAQPGFNVELLNRLAALASESDNDLEVHPANKNYPSIRIYPCPDENDTDDSMYRIQSAKIPHTPRPPC